MTDCAPISLPVGASSKTGMIPAATANALAALPDIEKIQEEIFRRCPVTTRRLPKRTETRGPVNPEAKLNLNNRIQARPLSRLCLLQLAKWCWLGLREVCQRLPLRLRDVSKRLRPSPWRVELRLPSSNRVVAHAAAVLVEVARVEADVEVSRMEVEAEVPRVADAEAPKAEAARNSNGAATKKINVLLLQSTRTKATRRPRPRPKTTTWTPQMTLPISCRNSTSRRYVLHL
ncbi:hypothetical protein BKA80DRAFT_303248 [Phyllosticta citrichinensis]